MRFVHSLLLALLLTVSVFGSTAAVQEVPPTFPETAGMVLRDRIVAVVDEDPILLSDMEILIAFGQLERQPGELDLSFRQRVLDGLIDQRLRYHEVARFGLSQVPVEQIEERVAEIRGRYPSPAAFDEQLARLGLTEQQLRQLVARQLAILEYVDERLGPRIFVGLEDIRNYYQQELVPALTAQGAAVPPIEEVREEIRALLKSQRLNAEIVRWTDELRREADVEILIDDYPPTLPPVVERIE